MFLNYSYYKFVPIHDLPELRVKLKSKAIELGVKGTILIAEEGINSSMAGDSEAMEEYRKFLKSDPRFADLIFKDSESTTQPFTRMLVKIKKEIVTMGVPYINPGQKTAPSLAPKELKRWLDEGKDFLLLDTRNDYEVQLGTFTTAADLCIESFRDFPNKARMALTSDHKKAPIVMFCTGGIRCEKATPFVMDLGFDNVYQLEGGILNYFKECGGAHWDGQCFVFDHRVGLDPALQETGAHICEACLYPMPKEITKCPRCNPHE